MSLPGKETPPMWSSLIGVAVLGMNLAATPHTSFSQEMLEKAYNEYTPAIALLRYTSEITNEGNGEISKRNTTALALIVSRDGLVMAHGHMVQKNAHPFNIVVTVGQGDDEKEYEAELLKKPDDVNVTFLRLQSEETLNLPYVSFARNSGLKLGTPVVLFGILPETLDNNRGMWEERVGSILEKPRKTYCLESSLRFGFVGGPVVDGDGRAVGVVGFDLSRAEGGDLYVRSGHPLVYNAELFQKYIDQPPSKNEIIDASEHAYLGVFTQPLTDDFAEYWNLEKKGGLIVSTVVPGSPAAEVGLQPGDVIGAFDGTPIRAKLDRDVLDFTKLVRETGASKEVEVDILRDGQPMTLPVTLAVRPRSARDAGEYEDEVFGLTVREITTDVRIALNLSDDVQGVIVRRVRSGSAAQVARMKPGVIVMSFGDHPVTGIESFKEAVTKVVDAKPAELSVFARVGSASGFFRIEPRWDENE